MLEQRLLRDELEEMEMVLADQVYQDWKHKLQAYEKLLNKLIYGYGLFFM